MILTAQLLILKIFRQKNYVATHHSYLARAWIRQGVTGTRNIFDTEVADADLIPIK